MNFTGHARRNAGFVRRYGRRHGFVDACQKINPVQSIELPLAFISNAVAAAFSFMGPKIQVF
jgi:hypothetical protein